MKTNFTIMGKLFMAITLVAFTLSCSKDEEPKLDISGQYTLQSATLVDGNVNDSDDASDLVIVDGYLLLTGQPGDVVLPAGESQITSAFVDAVLRGAAPCESQDLTSWTYQMDIKSSGVLAFDCTSEDISEDTGTWKLLEDNTVLSMSVEVSFSPIPIPITIKDIEVTDTAISGTVESFPMLKDAKYAIGAPIDGNESNLNVQYLSANITLAKVE